MAGLWRRCWEKDCCLRRRGCSAERLPLEVPRVRTCAGTRLSEVLRKAIRRRLIKPRSPNRSAQRTTAGRSEYRSSCCPAVEHTSGRRGPAQVHAPTLRRAEELDLALGHRENVRQRFLRATQMGNAALPGFFRRLGHKVTHNTSWRSKMLESACELLKTHA